MEADGAADPHHVKQNVGYSRPRPVYTMLTTQITIKKTILAFTPTDDNVMLITSTSAALNSRAL